MLEVGKTGDDANGCVGDGDSPNDVQLPAGTPPPVQTRYNLLQVKVLVMAVSPMAHHTSHTSWSIPSFGLINRKG